MKTKLLLLLLLLTSSYLQAQIVNIPDPEFKSYLLYNFDTNNDNQIQVTEAQAAIGGINVAGDPFVWGEITDLTGIEAFVNITELQCQLNLIDQPVDLSQNLALMRVICYDNSISSLSLGNNTVLTELDCHENNLGSLDVSQCTALEDLDCSNNMIDSLEIGQNENLIILTCQDNQLNNLIVNDCTSLEWLECGFNNLIDIDLTHNSNIILFACGYNQVISLDLSNNLDLEYLFCGNNQLSILDLRQNNLLKKIYCDNNPLTLLDIRNGNNEIITDFHSSETPYLTCIFVDDKEYSANNWTDIDDKSTFVETQEDCDAIGIDEYLSAQISVYPNPVSDYLHIKAINKHTKVLITNMIGEIMYASHLNTNQTNKIDISHLNSGIYILNIQTNNNQILTHKIIKL